MTARARQLSMSPRAVKERADIARAKIDGRCLDCRKQTTFNERVVGDEYYMVHDELWLRANPKGKGKLCIGCLEERLGRRLKPNDFTDCLLNGDMHGKSRRLISRLQPQQRRRVLSRKKITGLHELADAVETIVNAAAPELKTMLAKTFDDYARDFPEEYFWATGAQAPVLLHRLMFACEPVSSPKAATKSKAQRVNVN